MVPRWKSWRRREEFYQDNATGRGVAGLDVALRRLHCDQTDHRACLNTLLGEHCKFEASGAQIIGAINSLVERRSRMATYVRISIPSICFELLSVSPMLASTPDWRKAREDSCRYHYRFAPM